MMSDYRGDYAVSDHHACDITNITRSAYSRCRQPSGIKLTPGIFPVVLDRTRRNQESDVSFEMV